MTTTNSSIDLIDQVSPGKFDLTKKSRACSPKNNLYY